MTTEPCEMQLDNSKCGKPSAGTRSEKGYVPGSYRDYHFCAEHIVFVDALNAKYRQWDRAAARGALIERVIQWICVIGIFALCAYFGGLKIALLAMIAGSVLYIALKVSSR